MATEEDLEVMGVKCRFRGYGRGGVAKWRGGWSSGGRAQPDEPWFSVRVERHGRPDGWQWWIVVLKVSYRSGAPVRWGEGKGHERNSARARFEGQADTLDQAELECQVAEEWLRKRSSS